MKYLFATMTMLGLLAVSSVAAYAANSYVESVLAGQKDLSKFRQTLMNTGVANELNENTEYTIFAPTNAAFAEISPRTYPCFYSYSAECRDEVAAVMRNHIAPRTASIQDLSKWSGGMPSIGTRRIEVEESTKGEYTVAGHRVLSLIKGDKVSLYPIDGLIITNEELALFRTQPLASAPRSATEK